MKIVGGREPEDRAGYQGDVSVVGDTCQFHRLRIGFRTARQLGLSCQNVTGTTTRWHSSFHSFVDSRQICGEFASHGMAINTDTSGIHFRLLFQKCYGPAGSHQHKIPIAVARRFNAVDGIVIRSQGSTDEMIDLVALRRMRGVKLAPIGLGTIPCHFCSSEIKLVASPINRNTGITTPRVSEHAFQPGRLAPSMNRKQGR